MSWRRKEHVHRNSRHSARHRDRSNYMPPPAQGAKERTSVVTWKVKAAGSQGNYKLVVRSSRGVAQTRPLIVKEPSESRPGRGRT